MLFLTSQFKKNSGDKTPFNCLKNIGFISFKPKSFEYICPIKSKIGLLNRKRNAEQGTD
jgi:hypothetical protein